MKLHLIEKKQISPDTFTFYFMPDSSLIWRPGQFLRYNIPSPNPDERGENRFFSIASAPFEGHIQLTTKFNPQSSSFKKDLQKLEVGQSIEGFGPSGHFTIDNPKDQYVFIAGGIGITPFRSIILDLHNQGKPLNITLLHANRTKEVLFKNEFETLAKKHPEFRIYYVISDEPVSKQHIIENIYQIPGKIDETLIKSLILNLKSFVFYISGPETMMMTFEEMLKKLGIPKEQIKRDYFPGYENF